MGPEAAAAATAAAETGGAAAATSWLTPEVAAALMASGTAAQMLAAQQQQKQQRSILNRAFDKAQASQTDATGQVLAEGSKMAAGAQMQAMQAAKDAATARTMSDLKGAGAGIIDTAGGQGVVSDAFTRAKADRMSTEGDRMSAIAREAAGVRAPSITGANNAMSRSALAERIGSMASDNRNQAQAAQLDAQSVQTPWYGDVGKIASLVGTVGMMAPAGAAAETGMNGAATVGATGGDGAFVGEMAAPTAAATGIGARTALAQALPAAATLARRRTQPMWMGR